jgi:hypothetical protein
MPRIEHSKAGHGGAAKASDALATAALARKVHARGSGASATAKAAAAGHLQPAARRSSRVKPGSGASKG